MPKTTCGRCGRQNDRLPQRYCRACHAAHMRATRPKYAELSPVARFKANCRAYTNVLQRRGMLARGTCEVCGEPAQNHHENYHDPRTVRRLCRTDHLKQHPTHSKGDL